MILRRIRISQVACFREGVETDPLDPGLNVLAANNEEGKSTLVRAAARALFDRYSGKSQEIRALQPAGTELAPRVSVEFSTGEKVYLLEKRFIHSAESRLYQQNQDNWELVAEGDRADGRTLELIGGERPGAGATKPQHWGLLRYLWARQDEVASWPSWEGAAGQRIQAALAQVEVDPVADALETAFAARFQECFTARGQVKRNGPLRVLNDELEGLKAELQEVEQARVRLEEQQEEFRRLSEELAALRDEMERNRKEAERLSEEARQAELAARDVKALEKAYADAETRLQAVGRDADRLRKTREELAKNREERAGVEEMVTRLARQRKELEERQAAAATERKTAEDTVRRLKSEQADIRHLLKIAGKKESLAEKKKLLEKVERRERELKESERVRAGLPRLSEARLRELRGLSQEIRDLKNQLASAGLSVSLEPSKTGTVETETPEQGKQEHRLEAGEKVRFSAVREWVLNLPEWGRVEIHSGAEEVREKQQALGEAAEKLAAGLREHGKEKFEDLEDDCARARELDAELKNLRKGVSDLLGTFESVDALRRAAEEEEASIAELAGMKLADESLKTVGSAELRVRETENEVRLRSAEEGLRAKDRNLESLREELNKTVRSSEEAGVRLTRLRTAAVELETRLKEIGARYEEGFEAERNRVSTDFVKAEARLEEAKKALPEDWESLPKRRERAVKAAVEAAGEHDRRNESRLRLEGELKHRGSEGLYSREVRLREKIAAREEEAAGVRRRAGAAGFLELLLAFRKREAFERVLAPLEDQLSVQFAELTGRRERRVFLDENLRILAVGRDRESGIPFESLSQGAKEQLLLAMRAAVALELAKEEPQILILDDVLVNTDPTRQQRVLDFLESVARSVQVLVLTCHPDRYRGAGTSLKLNPVANE